MELYYLKISFICIFLLICNVFKEISLTNKEQIEFIADTCLLYYINVKPSKSNLFRQSLILAAHDELKHDLCHSFIIYFMISSLNQNYFRFKGATRIELFIFYFS